MDVKYTPLTSRWDRDQSCLLLWRFSSQTVFLSAPSFSVWVSSIQSEPVVNLLLIRFYFYLGASCYDDRDFGYLPISLVFTFSYMFLSFPLSGGGQVNPARKQPTNKLKTKNKQLFMLLTSMLPATWRDFLRVIIKCTEEEKQYDFRRLLFSTSNWET